MSGFPSLNFMRINVLESRTLHSFVIPASRSESHVGLEENESPQYENAETHLFPSESWIVHADVTVTAAVWFTFPTTPAPSGAGCRSKYAHASESSEPAADPVDGEAPPTAPPAAEGPGEVCCAKEARLHHIISMSKVHRDL